MMLVAEAVTHDIGPLLANVLTGAVVVLSNIATAYITYLVNKNSAIKAAVVVAKEVTAEGVVERATVLDKVAENDAKTDELIETASKIQKSVNGNTEAMRMELDEARRNADESRKYVAEVREQLAALRGLAGKAIATEAVEIVATVKATEAATIVEAPSEPGKPGEAKIVVKGGDAEPGQYQRVEPGGMGS